MKKVYKLIPIVTMAMPMMVLAAATASKVTDIVEGAKNVVDAIIPLFMAIAVAVFLWGIIKYITSGGDAEKEKAARGYIIYGLIGMFVLVSFWGIIAFLSNAFGVDEAGTGSFADFDI
ncbi:hypothetical protein ACFLZC_01915 [Patescibacteria group bacterium]